MIHTRLAAAHSAMALSSESVYTDPVGLHGEQRMIPRARCACASRSFTLTLRPHSGSPGTSTGSARARWTICGYDTHAGAGMRTRSPGPKSEKQALKIDCLDPELTTMWSALTARPPERRDSWWAMA